MDLRPFEAFALTHHGLLHWHAARTIGASRSTWYRMIERGIFEKLHANVVRMIGSERSCARSSVRASRACRRSECSSTSAQSTPTASRTPSTTSSRSSSRHMRASVKACTGTARRGHHGIAALRTALDAREIDGTPSDGRLEMRTNELLRTRRLPPAQFHAVVCGDRLRNRELSAAGYVIVHFTWRQLTGAPSKVAVGSRRTLRSGRRKSSYVNDDSQRVWTGRDHHQHLRRSRPEHQMRRTPPRSPRPHPGVGQAVRPTGQLTPVPPSPQ